MLYLHLQSLSTGPSPWNSHVLREFMDVSSLASWQQRSNQVRTAPIQPRFPILVPIPVPWRSFKPLLEQTGEKVPFLVGLSIRDARPVFFWLDTSSGSKLLWAGLVLMLGGCRIFWQSHWPGTEGRNQGEIHDGKPMADIPVLNIRCNELMHCNSYSFSRKKTQPNFIFLPICKRERKFCHC